MEVREEALKDLDEYSRIPIAFEVRSVVEQRVREGEHAEFEFCERAVSVPFIKDYDALPWNRPSEWAERLELTNWGMLSVYADERRVGGVVIALDEARSELAVVWDIRVHPELRRSGVGSLLFAAAARWAKERGCRTLRIETQNINVPACRFYARQGCTLGAIDRSAYPDLPDEIQLLWYKDLSDEDTSDVLTIRTATEADAPVIASIIGESFREQAELLGISRTDYPNYVAFETEARVRSRLDAGVHIALASRGDQVVGTVSSMRHHQGSIEITRLAVLPAQRGNGYGRELMEYAESRLVALGAAAVEISIVAKFQRLQAYYEQLGYSAVELKRVPSLPFELLTMRKLLESPRA